MTVEEWEFKENKSITILYSENWSQVRYLFENWLNVNLFEDHR